MSDREVIAGGSRSDRVIIDKARLALTGLHHLFFRGVFFLLFLSLFRWSAPSIKSGDFQM